MTIFSMNVQVMQITVEKLLTGKGTTIKDKEYFPTADYVGPFIDELKRFTDNFVVEVQVPSQMTVTDRVQDLTFNRVLVQAIMPSQCDIMDYQEMYCLSYALDTRVPIYKVYRCYRNKNDGTIMAFNRNWFICKQLKPGEKLTYSLKELMESYNDLEIKLKSNLTKVMESDIKEKHRVLGQLLDRALVFDIKNAGGKVKLPTALIIKAFESIYNDSASKYYTLDGSCDLHNYYNALSALIVDDKKDFINLFEKILLIGQLFDLV